MTFSADKLQVKHVTKEYFQLGIASLGKKGKKRKEKL